MDFSSLPEDQQKQLQQLQQQFQEHQLQRQQQEQQQQQQQQQQQIHDYAAQAYDPPHSQAYDQSYYAYYQSQDPKQSHHYSQHHPPEQQHHNYASSYQSDYANAHHQQPHQQHSQVDPALTHSRGYQDNAYHPQQGVPAGEAQNPAGYGAPHGLNPAAAAAVAALSQLAQFAGSMEAAEKAIALVGLQARGGGYGQTLDSGSATGLGQMHHGTPFHSPGAQSPYRGGGRRGGRPFRGNGRGNFGDHPPVSGDEGPSFRGRGRGRGRGTPRRFPPDGAASSSHPKPSPNAAGTSGENAEAKAVVPETTQTPVPKQGNPVPNKRPPQAARCELCNVDCTSMEILEQHKNGKKHKKNLQKAGKAVPEMPHQPKSVADSTPLVTPHPETVQDSNLQQKAPTTDSVVNGSNVGVVQQNDEAKQPEVPGIEQPKAPETASRSTDQMRGTKRKIRGGGRGGKRVKSLDPAKPSKPKVVIPLICDLCNIRCDTQEVFDRHLAGKKHISKRKRFEGHQAMYGPSGLQALYPPNPIAQSMFVPQGPPQQPAYDPRVVGPPQQPAYDPRVSYPPPEPYVPPHAPHYSAAASVFQQNINHQVSGSTPYY